MPGRFVLSESSTDLVALFEVDDVGTGLPSPSWNIAPTTRIHVLADAVPRGEDVALPRRRLESARWGLVPAGSPGPDALGPAAEAPIESVPTAPVLTSAFMKRRAAIPATGWYERVPDADGRLVPHFIHDPSGSLVVFAAVYEWWKDPAPRGGSPWLLSAALLTTRTTGALSALTERMPVLLDPEFLDEWLDPTAEGDGDLLETAVASAAEGVGSLSWHAVSDAVGTAGADGPDLIAERTV